MNIQKLKWKLWDEQKRLEIVKMELNPTQKFYPQEVVSIDGSLMTIRKIMRWLCE